MSVSGLICYTVYGNTVPPRKGGQRQTRHRRDKERRFSVHPSLDFCHKFAIAGWRGWTVSLSPRCSIVACFVDVIACEVVTRCHKWPGPGFRAILARSGRCIDLASRKSERLTVVRELHPMRLVTTSGTLALLLMALGAVWTRVKASTGFLCISLRQDTLALPIYSETLSTRFNTPLSPKCLH